MASKTFYSNKYDNRQLRLELTQYQDIATNRSRIHWKFISQGNTPDATLYQVYATTIKINGQQVYYKGLTYWYGTGTAERPVKVFPACEGSVEGDVWVNHNNDGSLTIPIYFRTGVYASAYHKDYGGNFPLDSIPRGATVTAADNFNDEGNPSITYSNPAGNTVSSLVAGIFDNNGQTAYAGYREISKTGSSYTFTLSDAERAALRNAATGNTLTVRFYVRTTLAGNNFFSSIPKTFSIVNGNPTLNPTVVDTNETTKALTGDANKLVRYYSNAYYTVNAGAVKSASLSSQKATHAGVTQTAGTGTFNGIQNGSFAFEAKDSRGNVTTKTITKTLIEYVKLTCNQKIEISAEGTAKININGNYFNGSFGATANTLTVQYRYKESGGTFGGWTSANATPSGNAYDVNVSIPGLNYQKAYVFQCRAFDKLATVSTNEKTVKSLPVFDWGEDDFHIHGDLVVEGTIVGSNATAAVTLGDDIVVPAADFIIEQGNNGSYAYKKWNSGLMEAWRSAKSTVSATSSSTAGSMYYSDQVSLTTNGSASQFISLESVQVTVNKNGAIGFWIPVVARTNVNGGAASADVFFVNGTKDSTAAIIPQIHFIGRWK